MKIADLIRYDAVPMAEGQVGLQVSTEGEFVPYAEVQRLVAALEAKGFEAQLEALLDKIVNLATSEAVPEFGKDPLLDRAILGGVNAQLAAPYAANADNVPLINALCVIATLVDANHPEMQNVKALLGPQVSGVKNRKKMVRH